MQEAQLIQFLGIIIYIYIFRVISACFEESTIFGPIKNLKYREKHCLAKKTVKCPYKMREGSLVSLHNFLSLKLSIPIRFYKKF